MDDSLPRRQHRRCQPPPVLLPSSSITHLNLSRCQLNDAALHRLMKSILLHCSSTTTVEVLDLSHNLLTSRGARVIADVLQTGDNNNKLHPPRLPKLHTLKLAHNPIGDVGGRAIAMSLGYVNSSPVRVLDLGYTRVGNACADALADTLQYNQTLREVRLCDTEVTDRGVLLLVDAVIQHGHHHVVRRVRLCNSQVELEECALLLRRTLRLNVLSRQLCALLSGNNPISRLPRELVQGVLVPMLLT